MPICVTSDHERGPYLSKAGNVPICWTKIQVETGQLLGDIVLRKNLERKASGGLFFWGVGNAPNKIIKPLLAREKALRLIFSVMRSIPKNIDAQMGGMLVWTTYFDSAGREIELPEWAFITSRINKKSFPRHYALVCRSDQDLIIHRRGPFDHRAFRNAGPNGLPVAPSQVTAIVERVSEDSESAAYFVDMEAELVGDFWVKLGRPVVFGIGEQRQIYSAASSLGRSSEEWCSFIYRLRQGARSSYLGLQQGELGF